MRTLLLAISLLTTVILSAQELPPAPHTAAFQAALVKPYTLSGVFRDGFTEEKELVIEVSNLRSSYFIKDTVSVGQDGQFSHTLSTSFPAVKVRCKIRDEYYGFFWLDANLHLDIQSELVTNKEGQEEKKYTTNFSGDGKPLNEAHSNFFKRMDMRLFSQFPSNCIDVVIDKKKTIVRRKAQIDSIYNELVLSEEKLLANSPKPFQQYWVSERENEYLTVLCDLYFGNLEKMPDDVKQRIDNHQPRLASVSTYTFYKHHFQLLNHRAITDFWNDSTQDVTVKKVNFVNSSCALLDSLYSSARADVYKLCLDDKIRLLTWRC